MKEGDLRTVEMRHNVSWIWRSIMKTKALLKRGLLSSGRWAINFSMERPMDT